MAAWHDPLTRRPRRLHPAARRLLEGVADLLERDAQRYRDRADAFPRSSLRRRDALASMRACLTVLDGIALALARDDARAELERKRTTNGEETRNGMG